VATYSQGCSVSFAGSSLTELTSVQLELGGGLPIGRSGAHYAPSGGSVTAEALAPGSFNWGQYGSLSISGGGISLTYNAVCTGKVATAAANDVTRYTFTFDLIG
jgi:hypothetical protein